MKKADNAKKKRPSYRDFYEFARLMKMAGKNICADGINKEIYIHNIIGSLVPDGKGWGLPHMAMRDDSGYRSIFIEGKDGSDDESYALLYADNEDENTGYRYRCYPPLRDMVSILKNIYNGKKDDSVEYHIVRKGTLQTDNTDVLHVRTTISHVRGSDSRTVCDSSKTAAKRA